MREGIEIVQEKVLNILECSLLISEFNQPLSSEARLYLAKFSLIQSHFENFCFQFTGQQSFNDIRNKSL